jgi:hypothetical protein
MCRGQERSSEPLPHDKLANRMFRAYERRMEQIMRRSEDTSLGPYTLGTFKRFYAGLQSICAIHDFLCFRWAERTRQYPTQSAVPFVKRQQEWIQLLSSQSGIDLPTTEQILRDLTFHSKRLSDLHVFPFVPLDENRDLLALVPQILAASPEDNILRTCSYLREKAYSLLSDDKAATMRDNLLETQKRFGCDHSIPLPDGSTEIDLVIEDHVTDKMWSKYSQVRMDSVRETLTEAFRSSSRTLGVSRVVAFPSSPVRA